MTDRQSTTRAATAAGLLCALALAAGCTSLQGGAENFNKPAVYEGPGCYDFKGRIDRTIGLKPECDKQGWVWRTDPKPAGPAVSQPK
jgi:hypothetical protein